MLGQPKTACFQKYLRNVRRWSSMRWYLLVIDGTELVCGDTVWCLVVLGGTGSVYARKPSCLYIESKSGDLVKRIRSLTHSLTDFESSWVVRLELSQRRKVKSIYKKWRSRAGAEQRSVLVIRQISWVTTQLIVATTPQKPTFPAWPAKSTSQ